MATAVDGTPLTGNQLVRRQRVIRAALQLAAEGGYDAVQMREVANTSAVALGTIYRYFSSKDHLLAAAMAEWTTELQERLARQPARGATPADQVVDVLRRACRSIERHPTLARALVRALGASDPTVGEAAHEVSTRISAMTSPILANLSEAELADIVAVLGHVWYSTLVSWANGRLQVRAIGDELERAARLLLAAHPELARPAAAPRARSGNGAARRSAGRDAATPAAATAAAPGAATATRRSSRR
ncbi:MAG: TetR/AcrR family transcriptional regulator [Actinobacteria bacterium]|nr:TetR/AcrR family transcriptional regulator [Actinomycetota bacterium]